MKKVYFDDGSSMVVASNVSLNWILNDECEIIKLRGSDFTQINPLHLPELGTYKGDYLK